MEKPLLEAYIKTILDEALTPNQVSKVEDKYKSIYSGMLKGNKKKLMKYVDQKFKRPNPDAMAMGRAINLVKKDTETEEVNEGLSLFHFRIPPDKHGVTLMAIKASNQQAAEEEIKKKYPTAKFIKKGNPKDKPLNENSYVRVSKPRFVKDKNNPNFLNVYMDYDIGSGGSSIALGKETMSGQIRRESAAEAMKQMNGIANELEAKHNIEDIEVVDMENGKVRLFAVSDDFNDMVFESSNKRLSSMVREVYSEKQRKWACAQDEPKFDEMCKDTAISKKKLKEERTSTVSKSRAKSELKQMLQGYRDDGMGKSTLKAVLAIDKDGKETKINKLEDFSKFEKGTKFELKENKILKEFTTIGGNYRESFQHNPPTEKPGDMFAIASVEELFPAGMASRGTFEDRKNQHLDWTKGSQYNNTFTHMQYHLIEFGGVDYGVHQTQYYNGNYDDFRSPRYTELHITKDPDGDKERLGNYIVDTTEYIKDLKDLNVKKRVSENKIKNTMKNDRLTELIKTALKGPVKEDWAATEMEKKKDYGATLNPASISKVDRSYLDVSQKDEAISYVLAQLKDFISMVEDPNYKRVFNTMIKKLEDAKKESVKEDKDWIQKAIKRPGALHRELGVPKDKDIPKSLINKTLARLRKKDKDDEEEGTQLGAADERELRQLNLAKTLSKFNENKLAETILKKLRG